MKTDTFFINRPRAKSHTGKKNRSNYLVVAAMAIAALLCTSCSKEPKLHECTVTFESNSGSLVAAQTVMEGERVTKPHDPLREGYIFTAWCKEASLTTEWKFDTDVVTADMTLYAKWSVKLLKTALYAHGSTKYEYDNQYRLVKHSIFRNDAPINPVQIYEYRYNAAGDLVKRDYYAANPQTEITEEFTISGNTITVTLKERGLPDVEITLSLNSDGYPIKREELRNDFIGGATYIRTYNYQNGNISKTSQTRTYYDGVTITLSDYEYLYDNMRSPLSCVKTPKWFMMSIFGTTGGPNNITKESYYVYTNETTRQLYRTTDYVYEYDSDGFPTKYNSLDSDGYETEIFFEYEWR